MFDPANLATAPTEVLLKGEQPRALAVSPDGNTVYCAFFESGNATTVLNGNNFFNFQHGTFGNGTPRKGVCSPQGGCTVIPNDVTNPAGPYGGAVNAAAGIVPNAGTGFNPPLNLNNPPTPETKSLIVRKNAAGQWMDDNGGNWTTMVSGKSPTRPHGGLGYAGPRCGGYQCEQPEHGWRHLPGALGQHPHGHGREAQW